MATTSASLTKRITAIVLASGYGRRFGGEEDKLLTPFKDKPLFMWIMACLSGLPFDEIIIVTRQSEILACAESMGYIGLFNSEASEGMSASIRLGIQKASLESEAYMFFTADQPFLKPSDVLKLMVASQNHEDAIIIPCVAGRRGSPTLFPASYRKTLLALSGEQGGRLIINQNHEKLIEVELESEQALLDIDTLTDLMAFERRYT